MLCYRDFARSFRYKVLAAQQTLNYKWSKDVTYLEKAVPLLEKSNSCYRQLAARTANTYLYANSMQTAQRRIPVGGDGGKYKTWTEMLPVYEEELAALKENMTKLSSPESGDTEAANPFAQDAKVSITSPYKTVRLAKGARLFEGRDESIDSVAAELEGITAVVLNRDTVRTRGASIEFECDKSVMMLVGFYVDDQNKYAKPPKLETDATGNEYGQAEPLISNAVRTTGMPTANIHAYRFKAGRHAINLPKGIIMIAGFTATKLRARDAKLNGGGSEVDWLFMR